jgi:hypothetical protein
MICTVVLEQTPQGYSAVVPALPGCHAEGASRDEVITGIRMAIRRRLNQVEITTVTVDEAIQNPWVTDAGLLADHPCWGDFQEGIALARPEAEDRE